MADASSADQREATAELNYPPRIGTATRCRVLRVAISAEQTKILRPVIRVHTVDVLEDQWQGLVVPCELFDMELTLCVVASIGLRWNLRTAPLQILALRDSVVPLAIAVHKRIVLLLAGSLLWHCRSVCF